MSLWFVSFNATKYVLPTINGDQKNTKLTRVVITIITSLKKLQENILEVQNNVGANQWSIFL